MFEKPALTNRPIHDLLARRWSTRAFRDQPVTSEELATLLEAARWAPSSGNAQPWSFIVALKENSAAFEKLASVLNSGNAWARSAGALLLSVASLERAPGTPNRHAWHDVGLASENIALQAHAMGLGLHMMGGFNHELAREVFQIPEQFAPVAMLAVGHPADPNTLDEALRAKDLAPRVRKPLDQFVFEGNWGTPSGVK